MNTLIAAVVTVAVIGAVAGLFYFLRERYPHSRTILFNRGFAAIGGVVPILLQASEVVDLSLYFKPAYVGLAILALTILNEMFRRDTTGPIEGKK